MPDMRTIYRLILALYFLRDQVSSSDLAQGKLFDPCLSIVLIISSLSCATQNLDFTAVACSHFCLLFSCSHLESKLLVHGVS